MESPPGWLEAFRERRATEAAAAAAADDAGTAAAATAAATTPFDTVKFIARASLGVGVLGAGAGLCLATFRGHDTSLYAVTMGANYTIITAMVLGAETGVSSLRGKPSDVYSYGYGGALAGGYLGGWWAGPVKVIPGMLMFGGASALARHGFELAEANRRAALAGVPRPVEEPGFFQGKRTSWDAPLGEGQRDDDPLLSGIKPREEKVAGEHKR